MSPGHPPDWWMRQQAATVAAPQHVSARARGVPDPAQVFAPPKKGPKKPRRRGRA